jgi:hypothetical protein
LASSGSFFEVRGADPAAAKRGRSRGIAVPAASSSGEPGEFDYRDWRGCDAFAKGETIGDDTGLDSETGLEFVPDLARKN